MKYFIVIRTHNGLDAIYVKSDAIRARKFFNENEAKIAESGLADRIEVHFVVAKNLSVAMYKHPAIFNLKGN